ncbi:hypothetical protein MM35RIKEN_17740 (plasmid) [Vescimonas fastidiosa]|uniref:Uncharacterized protein n=1 Tax=Vescimonas fastidiosa TaxID=2714353 RepID=A0A810PZY7_9FIRM|nr:hypothetical protein MM35RIKEN_17740 [Vescimonas fastidiosa]
MAAVKISSVRRKAAQKFWAPQQDHRPLRTSIGKRRVGADAYIGPVAPIFKPCVGAGFSCPPSCQPIPGHCRVRQSGHFLETGSLHPPLAALRRFPRPREGQSPSPTDGYK